MSSASSRSEMKLVPAGTGTVDYDTLEIVDAESHADHSDYSFISDLDDAEDMQTV